MKIDIKIIRNNWLFQTGIFIFFALLTSRFEDLIIVTYMCLFGVLTISIQWLYLIIKYRNQIYWGNLQV